MSDGLSYYEQSEGGVFGQPDAGDPIARAELQERVQQQMILRASQPGYVPSTMGGLPSAPEWAAQTGGPSNLPIIGWTVQNSTGPAFRPYDSSHIGRIPDWTGDSNSLAAGRFDQNQAVTSDMVNSLNRGPIGEPFFNNGEGGQPPNPNAPTQDISGSIDLEW